MQIFVKFVSDNTRQMGGLHAREWATRFCISRIVRRFALVGDEEHVGAAQVVVILMSVLVCKTGIYSINFMRV